MFGLGMPEIIIIVVVLGIIFFGSNKITEIAKTAGRFSGEYKKSKTEMEQELNKIKNEFRSEESKAVASDPLQSNSIKEEKIETEEEKKFSKFG